jgi:hypothetical protein
MERVDTLKLWIQRKCSYQEPVSSRRRRKPGKAYEISEGEVGGLPGLEFRTTVFVELYPVHCPDCGIKIEKVLQLPSNAPFSKRFEGAIGEACESPAERQVARRFATGGSMVIRVSSWANAEDRNHPQCMLRPPKAQLVAAAALRDAVLGGRTGSAFPAAGPAPL